MRLEADLRQAIDNDQITLAFQPIFDAPITIKDADQPIGTHIYTALDYVKDGADVRWSAVTMTSSQGRRDPDARRSRYDDEDDRPYSRRDLSDLHLYHPPNGQNPPL